MDAQQQLFGLMAVAEEHQKAVKAAIDGLTAERAALAKERAAVAQAAASVAGVAGEVRKAAADVVPAIQKAVGEAVGASVRQSLAGASQTASTALETAVKPILGKLSSVVQAAGEAEGKLNTATESFGWKWAAVASIVAAGAIVTVLAVAWGATWYQRHQVESLGEQKAALQADVAQLQASVDALEKKGGRIKLNRCGSDNRLCVEIAPNQGKGMEDFNGSWQDDKGNRRFVIPKGY